MLYGSFQVRMRNYRVVPYGKEKQMKLLNQSKLWFDGSRDQLRLTRSRPHGLIVYPRCVAETASVTKASGSGLPLGFVCV